MITLDPNPKLKTVITHTQEYRGETYLMNCLWFFSDHVWFTQSHHTNIISLQRAQESWKILPSMDQGSLENCWVLDNFSENGKQTIDACVWEIQRSIVAEEALVCITPPHACTFFQASSVTLQLQGK